MVPYQNPDIYIGSLKIQEPITVLTDLIVVCVCVFAFIKTKNKQSNKGVELYRWFFLTTGISTLVSAIIGHAFLYQWGFNAKIYGWVAGIISIAFGQFAALYHTREIIGEKKFTVLSWINAFEICLALVLVFVVFKFVVVEVHSAVGLILTVTLLEYINYQHTKSVLSKHMMMGVGIAVFAVLCHIFKLAISIWFNHMDLSHIIIALSVYTMYQGVALYQKKFQHIPTTNF
jgi:hypothetical protein